MTPAAPSSTSREPLASDAAFNPDDLAPPDPQELHQGDVFADVALVFTRLETPFVAKSDPGHLTHSEAPERGRVGQMVVDAGTFDAIVLSYDCEIDRILRNLGERQEAEYDDAVTVAVVRSADAYDRSILGNIKQCRVPRFLYFPDSAVSAAAVADFTTTQSIPLARLLQSERRFALATVGATAKLLRCFAYHFGSDERRQRPGPDEPGLLAAALRALGLRERAP